MFYVGLILAFIWALTVTGWAIYLYKNRLELAAINSETYRQNEELEKTLKQKQSELQNINKEIQNSTYLVDSLNETAGNLKTTAEEQARERAEQAYSQKMRELGNYYEQAGQRAKSELDTTLAKINEEKEKLKSLEDKQLAYIQAKQRQQEIDNNSNYYRLAIDSIDLNDIELLRELQKRFSKKESIDKLIWESYYKPAFDILMARFFDSHKTSGIYKITSLKDGQAYIGQSVDIKERFRQHIKSSLAYGTTTNKLYQTMRKDGPENFTFEIIEKVPKEQLNEREVYWIDFYKTKEFGMNGTRGGS